MSSRSRTEASNGVGTREGIETVTLSGPRDLDATFAPGAGMVCCSLRHAGVELLGQRKGLGAYAARGATMGIPLLHPWANRLGGWEYEARGRGVDLRPLEAMLQVDENALPIHGTVPGAWSVVDRSASGDGALLSAELEPDREDPAFEAFPFPHRVRLDVELLSSTLRIRTNIVAVTDTPVPIAFGFHPYLSLAGAPRESWHIELPVRRGVAVDSRSIPTGGHEATEPYAGPLGSRAFDDGYDRLADPAVFALTGADRRIEVAFEGGFPVAQVYAPANDDVICFEPMTAPTNALATGAFPVATLGAPYAATFSVSVSPG
jgi:aldose 1-epimerase